MPVRRPISPPAFHIQVEWIAPHTSHGDSETVGICGHARVCSTRAKESDQSIPSRLVLLRCAMRARYSQRERSKFGKMQDAAGTHDIYDRALLRIYTHTTDCRSDKRRSSSIRLPWIPIFVTPILTQPAALQTILLPIRDTTARYVENTSKRDERPYTSQAVFVMGGYSLSSNAVRCRDLCVGIIDE